MAPPIALLRRMLHQWSLGWVILTVGIGLTILAFVLFLPPLIHLDEKGQAYREAQTKALQECVENPSCDPVRLQIHQALDDKDPTVNPGTPVHALGFVVAVGLVWLFGLFAFRALSDDVWW